MRIIWLPNTYSTNRLPVNGCSIHQKIDASVGLLIGNNAPRALEPKEVKGQGNGLYAVRTLLGWTINGPIGRINGSPACANFVRSDSELSEQFQRFCDIEFSDTSNDKVQMSIKDSQALAMMENSVLLKKGHYEVALPWRTLLLLSYNRILAEHRLNLLKKRFLSNVDLRLNIRIS